MTCPTSFQRVVRLRRNRLRSSKPLSSIWSHEVITRSIVTVTVTAISTQISSGRVNTRSCISSGSCQSLCPTKLMITRNSSTTRNTKPTTREPITTEAGGPYVRVGRSPS